MSRRGRAIALAAAALACAGLAAGLAGGYRGEVESQFGELRPVVVASQELPAGRALRAALIGRTLELRRVPARFVPVDALDSPEEAIGLAPRVPVPAGSYLLASHLRPPGAQRDRSGVRVPRGREPVDIAVTGAEPLAARAEEGSQPVDVIVTTEPGPGGGPGRTYVAARAVPLLGLRPDGAPGAAEGVPAIEAGTWTATLALDRPQALRLIQAESFARQVRLIRHLPAG